MKRRFFLLISMLMCIGIYGEELENYQKGIATLENSKQYLKLDGYLNKAIEEYPYEDSFKKVKAKNLTRLKKYKDSFFLMEELLLLPDSTLEKDDIELYEIQIVNIKSLLATGTKIEGIDLNSFLENYTEIYNTMKNPILTDMDSDEIFKKGNELFKKKDYAGALKIYELDRTGDIRNLYGAGLTSKFTGNLDKAIEYFSMIEKTDPSFIRVYKELGMAYQLKDDYDKAVHYFTLYLDKEPDERTFIVLSNIYIGNYKDYKKAKEIALKGEKAFPNSAEIKKLLKEIKGVTN